MAGGQDEGHGEGRTVLGAALLVAAAFGAAADARGRPDLAAEWRQAEERRQAQRLEQARREHASRLLRMRSAAAHARLRAGAPPSATPVTKPDAALSCPVFGGGGERRRDDLGSFAAFAPASPLAASRGFGGGRLGRLSGTAPAYVGAPGRLTPYSPTQAHWAVGAAASAAGGGSRHLVPLFPRASDPLRQGFVRVANRSGQAGEAAIHAADDGGRRLGPVTLALAAGGTVHFNSNDLENGNAAKGLSGGVGAPSEGDWRLRIESSLNLEVLAYLRTRDGFLTAMHDLAPEAGGTHRIPIFNPGGNDRQASLLRLVNEGEADVEALVRGVDDRGNSPGGEVRVAVPAGAARTLSAAQLEAGSGPGVVAGALGDGAGKWRLGVTADGPIRAMGLLASPTGTMTNLSTAPPPRLDADGAPVHRAPLFPSASDPFRQGFVRVVNRSAEAGEVSVRARDDSGRDYEPVALAIGAGQAVHFNSDDLEQGNRAKGLSAGVGAGEGDWRLELRSGLDIEALAYVRTADGFLTSMHDLAPTSGGGRLAATFNPGGNDRQVSLLRLVNDGTAAAQVAISGVDDRGAAGGEVSATVPAGRSLTLSAAQLESGSGPGVVSGALGDGAGKWRLTVRSDRPIDVMSLLRSPTGHLTNLSTAPGGGDGAVTAASFFAERVSPVVQSKCVNCHVEGGASGNTRLVFVRSDNADHLALNQRVFADFLADAEGGAELILNKIQGVAHGGGVQAAAGTEDYASIERYLDLLGGESGGPPPPAPLTPATLFDSVAMAPAWRTLWRAAIVFAGRLPTAAEYERAERGPAGLRGAVRGLMAGDGFHDFLIRAANDRLLTDKFLHDAIGEDPSFPNLANAAHALLVAGDNPTYSRWQQRTQFGFARAPLELIAHVVENDLPYTEVLTADYVMANPPADEAYGGGAAFDDANDILEFKPSRIVDYYRQDESVVSEFTQAFGNHVTDPGHLRTDWPHAGILNTLVFLKRYPTTPTNRNRARSRWTYYHFLGLDVEKSASRTTDPAALADTDNPTMRNPACTVCHGVLDPVAGAFQNYGADGFYRDQWGGMDSLDDFYKEEGPGGWEQVEIDAPREGDKQTFSLVGRLTAGDNEIGLQNVNIAEGHTNILVDSLTVRDGAGEMVGHYELEDMADWDGRYCGIRKGDRGVDVRCRVIVSVRVPREGEYTIEVAAWTGWQSEEAQGKPGALRVWAPIKDYYREGDTWYRDMRKPGFDGREAPNPDNSVQWLARAIVADERFAEAVVKFWWPTILGAEVAEPPEDEADADFAGRLLASNAQNAEVGRLAHGFRHGFGGGRPFNLKDLLVEIVLSKWARAESTADDDPVRLAALRDAGMERLLTPEELAWKTAAATGVELRRTLPDPHTGLTRPSYLRNDGYRLLYGGIDSDGVTERAGDMAAVMAGVARNHAARLAGAIVLRELHLLPTRQRRLFRHVELATTPASEFGDAFEIEAASWGDRETASVRGHLTAGDVVVRLSYVNDHWEEDLPDYNLRLDRLELRDAAGRVVATRELEDLDEVPCSSKGWNGGRRNHHVLWCDGMLEVPLTVPADGRYSVDVVAWAEHADERLADLQILVESDMERSVGAAAFRRQLADLHRDLLGVAAAPDSAEVDEAFRLFAEVWRRKRESGEERDICWPAQCRWWDDLRFFEGIDDGPSPPVWVERENGYGHWEWESHDPVWEFLEDKRADPNYVSRTWAVVLAYLMTDHRYLHL